MRVCVCVQKRGLREREREIFEDTSLMPLTSVQLILYLTFLINNG